MSIKAKYSREKTAFIGWAPITRYKLGQTLRWADICSFVALTGRRKLSKTGDNAFRFFRHPHFCQ